MAIKVQSDTEIEVTHDEKLSTLQAILAAQGEAIDYNEAVTIGRELIAFFEAFEGDDNA